MNIVEDDDNDDVDDDDDDDVDNDDEDDDMVVDYDVEDSWDYMNDHRVPMNDLKYC